MMKHNPINVTNVISVSQVPIPLCNVF